MDEAGNLFEEANERWPLTEKKKPRSGYCGCIILSVPVLIVLHSMVHVFLSARTAAHSNNVYGAFKRITKAVLLYAEDHNGRLPGPKWTDAIRPYDPRADFDLRIDWEENRVEFAMMPRLTGRRVAEFDPSTILLTQYRSDLSNAIATDPNRIVDYRNNGYVWISTIGGDVAQRIPVADVRARVTKG